MSHACNDVIILVLRKFNSNTEGIFLVIPMEVPHATTNRLIDAPFGARIS
jgi:hypothetical protein